MSVLSWLAVHSMSSESFHWSVPSHMVFLVLLLLLAADWWRLLFGVTVLWETFIVSGVDQVTSNYREATKVAVRPAANFCTNCRDAAVGAAEKLCWAFSHKTP